MSITVGQPDAKMTVVRGLIELYQLCVTHKAAHWVLSFCNLGKKNAFSTDASNRCVVELEIAVCYSEGTLFELDDYISCEGVKWRLLQFI